jgi:hypothetical protein
MASTKFGLDNGPHGNEILVKALDIDAFIMTFFNSNSSNNVLHPLNASKSNVFEEPVVHYEF